MIEIAPIDRELRVTYEEALLYCFSLNIDGKIGWRLPNRTEWYTYNSLIGCWYVDRESTTGRLVVGAVRDIDK